MKKSTLLLIISMFVLILLAITNPTKTDYTKWLKEQYISQSTNTLDKAAATLFGDSLIEGSTRVKNFVFFSLYTTSIDTTNNVTTLGLFHNFILMQSFTSISIYMEFAIYIVIFIIVSLILLHIIYLSLGKQ